MIDNITIRTPYSNSEFERLVERLSLPISINSDKIKFDWKNLRFNYFPNSNLITVSNSLHKFYNLEFNELLKSSINFNDFKLIDLYTVVDYLSEAIFEKAASDLSVSTRFEFGLNINTDTFKPFDIISRYQSCVTTYTNEFFTNCPHRGKPIQRSCYFSDWYIKGYDKGKQANLSGINLMRYEIVVRELRKIRQIFNMGDVSLADLCTIESWQKMFDFLIKTYERIRKTPIGDEVMTVDEINSIYNYANKEMRSDLKRALTKYHFEQLNRHNAEIYDKFSNSEKNYHNIFKDRMYRKFANLLPAPVELQCV